MSLLSDWLKLQQEIRDERAKMPSESPLFVASILFNPELQARKRYIETLQQRSAKIELQMDDELKRQHYFRRLWEQVSSVKTEDPVSDNPPRRRGRPKDAMVAARRVIVKRYIKKKSDLDDDQKVQPMRKELDDQKIPLPKREGKRDRPQTWEKGWSNPDLKYTIRQSLEKDIAQGNK